MISHLDTSELAPSIYPRRWEWLAVGAYLVVFAVVATIVCSHARPHADAVMDADPAINAAMGKGPLSFIHPQVTPGSPLTDIAPVYGRVLTAWLRAFGISSESVMSMNAWVIASSTFLLWLFLARGSLLRHTSTRLVFVALVPLITPVATIYRINRYDSFGILGLAGACAALTVRDRSPRYVLLVVAGVLVGSTGFHVVIGGGLLTLLALVMYGRRRLPEFLAVNAGIAIGLGWVLANIVTSGSLEAIRTALEQNGVHATHPLTWHLLAPLRGGQRTGIVDADLLLLGCIACAAIGAVRRYAPRLLASATTFGLAAAIIVPLTLSGFGRYSDTYVWLTAIPVFTCCMIALDHEIDSWMWAACLSTLLAASAFVGFPAHALMMASEWGPQDRHVPDAWIESQLGVDDVVYACTSTYYPAKRIPRTAYIGSAYHSMTDEQRASVNLLVMDGHENGTAMFEPDTEEAIASFGGEWDLVAELKIPRGELRKRIYPKPKSDCTYHVTIHRRRTESASR